MQIPTSVLRFLSLLPWILCALCLFVAPHFSHAANDGIHRGPTLKIEVQRGEQRLPAYRVPQLKAGDTLRIQVDSRSIGEQAWVMLGGTLTASGHHLSWRSEDLESGKTSLEIPIQSSEQIPFLLIAPQLRNLFGLNTSYQGSVDLMLESIKADPQRFIDLQRVDWVNAAISALERGLETVLQQKDPAQGRQAVFGLAAKFGVKNLNPDCFRQEIVDTGCIALHILGSKDFLLPAAGELASSVGAKQAADLAGLLSTNLRFFVQAGDLLSQRFRDQYEFAASFGRVFESSEETILFSRTRLRTGSVKTAYVYVPAWFAHEEPTISVERGRPLCLLDAYVPIRFEGRLPLLNYWHSWWLTPKAGLPGSTTDQNSERSTEALAPLRSAQLSIHQERLHFDADALLRDIATAKGGLPPRNASMTVDMGGRYGFDNVRLESVQLWYPPSDAIEWLLSGQDALVSGQLNRLELSDHPLSSCIDKIQLLRNGQRLLGAHSGISPMSPVTSAIEKKATSYAVSLDGVAAGPAQLEVHFRGGAIQTRLVLIKPPIPDVRHVIHHALDRFVLVEGSSLDRIRQIDWGHARCLPAKDAGTSTSTSTSAAKPLEAKFQTQRFDCDFGSQSAPSRHPRVKLRVDGHDTALDIAITQRPARPRVTLVKESPAIVIRPGPRAMAWGLTQGSRVTSSDSYLSLLFRAHQGYQLQAGAYTLRLRLASEAGTSAVIDAGHLLLDHRSQELRTRRPISIAAVELPAVLSRLEYQVIHVSSQLESAWMPLGLEVIMLPELLGLSCGTDPDTLWLSGSALELIDQAQLKHAGYKPDQSAAPSSQLEYAQLVPCPSGLCLALRQPNKEELAPGEDHPNPLTSTLHLHIKLRWVDRIFSIKWGKPSDCAKPVE